MISYCTYPVVPVGIGVNNGKAETASVDMRTAWPLHQGGHCPWAPIGSLPRRDK